MINNDLNRKLQNNKNKSVIESINDKTLNHEINTYNKKPIRLFFFVFV